MKDSLSISILIIVVYILTSLVVPITFIGDAIFLANAVLWATVIGATIFISKLRSSTMWQKDKTVLQLAAIIAVFQIFIAVFAGFFMGFGKNTNVWTPSTLTVYLPYLIMPFFAMELSRAYVTQATASRKPTVALLFIGLFYTLILTPIPTYMHLTAPLVIAEFLIKTFIPTLAISILATYFAYLGGFPASIIYMAVPAFFTWFSPILPNPSWQLQSMITVTAATVGFLVLDQTVKPLPTKHIHRTLKKQKSQLPYWTAIALIGLIAVWSSTGLLGFTPTIIASGSMQPSLNPGDITIIISVPPATIKIGDIIQYQTADAPTIHRAIDKYEAGGSLWFITQGDANNAPDNPVNERNVMGKAVLTIPQLGWVSIYVKTAFTEIISFLINNITTAFATLSILLVASVFGVHRYRNQPLRKLRRRIGR